METAALLGRTAIMTSWDAAAFFDSVPLHLAISDSVRLNMPAPQLALGMKMHLAPRIIRLQGACAKPLAEHGRSILAGCTMSTSVARALLHEALANSNAEDGSVSTAQHVDDVTHIVVADSPGDAVRTVLRCSPEGPRYIRKKGVQ